MSATQRKPIPAERSRDSERSKNVLCSYRSLGSGMYLHVKRVRRIKLREDQQEKKEKRGKDLKYNIDWSDDSVI